MKNLKRKIISTVAVGTLMLNLYIPSLIRASAGDITTKKYEIINEYIVEIPTGETVETLVGNMVSYSNDEIKVYKGTNLAKNYDKICTGMVLKIANSTYTLVVKGDINGDGAVSTVDLAKLKSAIVKKNTLENERFFAADIERDGQLTTTDLAKFKMEIVKLNREAELQIDDIIITPSTTEVAKEVTVNVTWPATTEGYIKQISVNGGKTFVNNISSVTVTENETVIARLITENSKIIKSKELEITNIDNIAPGPIIADVIHTVANDIVVTATSEDASKYYFSKDNGATWEPEAGTETNQYNFKNVTENSEISLKIKAADAVGNTAQTETIKQRTFKKGIELLAANANNFTVNQENNTITLTNGEAYKLEKTTVGSYNIIPATERNLTDTRAADATLLEQMEAIKAELGTNATPQAILEKAVTDGILSSEQINVNESIFITSNENVYGVYRVYQENQVDTGDDSSTSLEIINDVQISYLCKKQEYQDSKAKTEILAVLEKAIKDQIIDWAIADGITTVALANKENGKYTTVTSNEEMRVYVDWPTGQYGTV